MMRILFMRNVDGTGSIILQAVVMAILFAVAVSASTVTAQEQKSGDEVPSIETLTVKVRVVSTEGEPVEDALVFPSGLRSADDPGSHYGWYPKRHGELPRVKTNEEGMAEVTVPKFVREKMRTSAITWSVHHPSFVRFRDDRKLVDGVAEIELEDGFRIALTAVDAATGTAIKERLFPNVSNGGWQDEWDLKNGIAVSRVFGPEEMILRVIHETDDGNVLFSESVAVPIGKQKSKVFLRSIKLHPAVRVVGKLSDDVPRPIKNGVVNAVVVDEGPQVDGGRPARWAWFDQAEIREDGSFVFESLPPNCKLQLLPVCEGWIGAKPTAEQAGAMFGQRGDLFGNGVSQPQLFPVEKTEVNPVLKMVKASTVRILVTDPDGNPLPDCTVTMDPNQAWFNLGTQILGEGGKTLESILDPKPVGDRFFRRTSRFQKETGGDGVVVMSDLPNNASHSIYVQHKQFEMPARERSRGKSIMVEPGQNEITIKLQAKGLDALGGTNLDGDQ